MIALGNSFIRSTDPHVSVAAGVAQNQSYWCSVVDEDDDDKLYATTESGAQVNYPNVDWLGTFAAASVVQVSVALLGGDNVCRVVQGATIGTVSGDTNGLAGAVQVATRSASASFDYVFAVSIGN